MKLSRVGVDLAKNVFQAHGVDRHGKVLWRRRLTRKKWLSALMAQADSGCEIGMEACAGAHHWARELQSHGYTVRMIPPQFVKPYVKSNKNDANDAEAICEAMKPTLARDLVVDALLMAVWRRKPQNKVLVHSDQGSQYGSDDWLRFCRTHNLEPSMSRRGNCWDNAVVESFFSRLKKERIKKRIYKTRDLAREDVFDYIEVFYTRKRRHSHLGGVSPEAFERASF